MDDRIIDGKKIAAFGEKLLKERICGSSGPPRLDTIMMGDDEGSKVYLGVKNSGCKRVGIETVTHEISVVEASLDLIDDLNQDDDVDGILLQMPLPDHVNPQDLIDRIDPVKDVEGLHPVNLGSLISGKEDMIPCTPKGILTMLDYEKVDLKGKEVCIVSHSMIVGKPMALLLLNRDATVTVVHEHTKDLSSHTFAADVVIAAAGVPGLITADMISPGAIVIDVGMNRLDSGELVGDVDFNGVIEKVSKITPVPGGVGPTTVLSLLENTYEAHLKRKP